jgi:hypothetical protein
MQLPCSISPPRAEFHGSTAQFVPEFAAALDARHALAARAPSESVAGRQTSDHA